jgi:acyl-CoA reductase-like NAD-dependent aldehyde dehydrogenase
LLQTEVDRLRAHPVEVIKEVPVTPQPLVDKLAQQEASIKMLELMNQQISYETAALKREREEIAAVPKQPCFINPSILTTVKEIKALIAENVFTQHLLDAPTS